MTRVVARLDPPSTRSLAVSALVLEESGKLAVSGLAPDSHPRAKPISTELETLLKAGHAATTNVEIPSPSASNLVSLWVGREFREGAAAVEVPAPPIVFQNVQEDDHGTWVVTTAQEAWRYLDHWTRLAFMAFRKAAPEQQRAIASLMRWALPMDSRTMAASWSVATDKPRELKWQLQAKRDLSTEDLEREHRAVLDIENPLKDVSLLVFVGGSGTLRKERAHGFAEACGLGWVSFTDVIARRTQTPLSPDMKKRLMEAGQQLVEAVPLTLVAEVLAQGTNQGSIVVVDSVRHLGVLKLLKWLMPDRVRAVGITAEMDTRRARLDGRKLDFDTILRHKTEREIDELVAGADRRYRESASIEEMEEELLAV